MLPCLLLSTCLLGVLRWLFFGSATNTTFVDQKPLRGETCPTRSDTREPHPRLFSNRLEMYQSMPKGGRVAEVGVWLGSNALDLYNILDPSLLVLVDPWLETADPRYQAKNMDIVIEKFHGKSVDIKRGNASALAQSFARQSFRTLYLDTTHDYRHTLEEIHLLHPLLEGDGHLCGHDFGQPPTQGWSYGVIAAVMEFCLEEGWYLSHVTVDGPHRSFCIRQRNSHVL